MIIFFAISHVACLGKKTDMKVFFFRESVDCLGVVHTMDPRLN